MRCLGAALAGINSSGGQQMKIPDICRISSDVVILVSAMVLLASLLSPNSFIDAKREYMCGPKVMRMNGPVFRAQWYKYKSCRHPFIQLYHSISA
jgi:hypothetical protein